jgi:DNA-binding XRE family transcriptional regulator
MIENIRKNRVKQFREAIPLSVSELALKARLTRQTIAKMEKGLPTRKNSELKVAKAIRRIVSLRRQRNCLRIYHGVKTDRL